MKDVEFTVDPAYNNSLYNSGDANSESSANPNNSIDDIHPFKIFNTGTVADLSIINRFIIRPAYKYLTSQLQAGINDSMSSFRLIYIIVFSVYFTLLIVFYLFVWRPFESNLNQTVFLIDIDL